ncbi:restriction endonuclease subunit S [Campylobacter upsaliensis]|uniref:restriction endonuclease subunit S n=1 Tax=Campylobacter upsaliensis TaxID=28080 RepID=UPI00214A837C|nr:restriction endonuclease subunit S [Campylobacter upsaliensis]MCR2106342.1 restriction endonuclease subunit S [Campylobacter upsaliensis]
MRVYKPSGIKWLGEIPKHWEIRRLKYLFYISKEESRDEFPNVLSLTQNGIIERDITTNKGQLAQNYIGYNIVKRGDIILNPMDLSSGYAAKSTFEGVISQAYIKIRPLKTLNLSYYESFFQNLYHYKILWHLGKGISYDHRWTLGNDVFLNIKIPLPPLQEQKEIAEFLDSKCEKIQNYIEKKQKLITLLQEKKQALINKVVTKGLNPNIEFKNSEIAYLGLIPHHWEVVKVKYIATTNIGLVYDPSEIATNENVGYPVLRANNIQNGKIDYKDVIYVAKKIDDKQLAISGDLLMCVRNGSENLLGKTAKIENNNFSFGAFTAIIRSDLNNYLYWIFQTEMLKKSISSFIVSIGIGQISQDDIKNFKIPLPPLQEQKQIANFLDKKCEKINSVIEKTKKQIELIKEYKNTLINEAVCGRINLERK